MYREGREAGPVARDRVHVRGLRRRARRAMVDGYVPGGTITKYELVALDRNYGGECNTGNTFVYDDLYTCLDDCVAWKVTYAAVHIRHGAIDITPWRLVRMHYQHVLVKVLHAHTYTHFELDTLLPALWAGGIHSLTAVPGASVM